MSTKTLSSFVKEPKANATGVNTRFAAYIPATVGTATSGSVIKVFRIPDRAIITDGYIYNRGSEDLTMNLVYQSGTASTTLLQKLVSSSVSGITRIGIEGAVTLAGALGYQVSLSDAVAIREAVVQVAVASASASVTAKFSISYTLDDDA